LLALTAAEKLAEIGEVLTPEQLRNRERAFLEASRFIENAEEGGGVLAPVKASFPRDKKRYGVDYKGAPRVDIEVRSGRAFVPLP